MSAVEDELPQGLPDRLPVLPLRDTVTYPDTLTPLAVGQERSIQLVNDVLTGDRMLVMLGSQDPDLDTPGPDQLHTVGVAGVVARMLKVPDGSLRILVQAGQRVKVDEWVGEEPYLVAKVSELPDEVEEGPELTALMRNVQQTFTRIIDEVPYLPEELQMAVANVEEPSSLAHLIAGALRIKVEEKQALLEEVDVGKRLRMLSEVLARELDIVAIGSKIQNQVMSEMESSQREYVLRQQLKAIQEELGEKDPAEAELEDLREQLSALALPEDVRKQADRELSRLEKLPQAAAEHGVIRTYLEWIASLPWGKRTEDNLDLAHARQVLDEDHYDIAKVKERILEFLAVRKLKPDATGSSIMCFVGPPGVGKTSLGKSIARAMGRRFERISAGGVRDEAEIRGHRRTYIGAMPGTIIRALRDAGAANPLFMIDEIDKMGADYRGDPASAMLEVLDPEQNSTFRDHYLDVPFDLSGVLFITTANTLDTIPPPLRDRMEIIQLAGYTEEEKLQIAKRYLVPRQIERSGLKRSQISFTDTGLRAIIAEYTREAGVRGLDREIGSVCRKVALSVAEGTHEKKVSVSAPKVRELLGRPKFVADVKRRTREPGVATGLAWTPVGGDVLFVEATAMPGKGKLTITGQLGDVMKESAQAAMSYVRGHADGLPDDWFASHDVHIHVPAGAIPKDGPSAGITMATALMSLVTGRPVRDDVAMTGELTLTGQVLPIGGLKEKALAAKRVGVKRVLAPIRNEPDAEEFPDALRENLDFVWVSEIGDVFDAALVNGHAGYARAQDRG
ncbi:endopeptidase La [Solirubrobacter sp. CPCC 204708]|uniref:Lon protease n=1 Tax=Solirubrobacter deserti TaxID=2282478 RepID=A0ABT4RIJ3_9ACTN|nr:endopeptidase La [Solirubrobacter deserti]MBE2318776.1 endopeptidase La [Solirubrobacter deserti]MDA0138156.1 endopeptidase La [Solirubrobacter deserti]